MTTRAKVGIAVIVAGLVLGLFGQFVTDQRAIGRRDVLLSQSEVARKAAEKSEAQWKSETAKLKGLVRVEIPAVIKSTTKYRTLRDTLRLTDTLEVKAAFAAADTVISLQAHMIVGLNAVIVAQDSAQGATDRRAAALESQNRILRDMVPGKASKFATAGRWLGAGIVIGYTVAHR